MQFNQGFAYPNSNMRQVYSPQVFSPNKMVWAIGRVGAETFPTAPGETIAIFDSENPYVRIKTVDNNGRPLPLKTFKLVEEEEANVEMASAPINDLSAYVTRDELAELVSKVAKDSVDKALSEISLRPASSRKKKEVDE